MPPHSPRLIIDLANDDSRAWRRVEAMSVDERMQLGYRLRLEYLKVPSWRDDPSYFWADAARRKREIPT